MEHLFDSKGKKGCSPEPPEVRYRRDGKQEEPDRRHPGECSLPFEDCDHVIPCAGDSGQERYHNEGDVQCPSAHAAPPASSGGTAGGCGALGPSLLPRLPRPSFSLLNSQCPSCTIRCCSRSSSSRASGLP